MVNRVNVFTGIKYKGGCAGGGGGGLYKRHMTHMLNRVNVLLTGIKYKGGCMAGCAGGGEPGKKWRGSHTNAIYLFCTRPSTFLAWGGPQARMDGSGCICRGQLNQRVLNQRNPSGWLN